MSHSWGHRGEPSSQCSTPGAACILWQQSQGPTWLVPGQHPHFNVPLFEALDGLRDTVLQFVFNGRGSQQLGKASVGSGTKTQMAGAQWLVPTLPVTHL